MRLRFAPSPTGALHIGGARTALYNWLIARGPEPGELVLRIEDTDRERSTPENVDQILDALAWLGIDYDEGPISQFARAERHQEVLAQLLDGGYAYRSNAGRPEVDAFKAQHGSERGYRGSDEGEGAIRLCVPDEGETSFTDLIRGPVTFKNVHLDEPVIARADGTVLYNFAVAIDDVDAGITHVVRGEDHLSNTPKQLLVLQALGKSAPLYAHLPLLHGPDGKKLSKRHGAASVQELREAGYLPEAVTNYLCLLGWGDADDETIISRDELRRRFDIRRVTRNPARFDEQKLRWMNGRYLRELAVDDLAQRLAARHGERPGLREAAAVAQEKMSTLAEFWPLCGFLWDGPTDDPAARAKVLGADGAVELLAAARERLAQIEGDFDVAAVQPALDELADERGIKRKALFQPIRVALTGTTISPGIYETVALLGQAEALARIDATVARVRADAPAQ